MKSVFAQVFDVRMTMVELRVKSMCDYDRAQGCDCLLPHTKFKNSKSIMNAKVP